MPEPTRTPDAASDHEIVGKGSLYEPILRAARDLVPVWVPWGVEHSQDSWGAPPFHLAHEDGKIVLAVETYGWEKRGLGHRAPITLDSLRATAISLLVFCATEEARDADA